MSMRDIKICLLGEVGVGKSSIVMRFVTDTFKSTLETTIGASFMTKTIVVEDSTFRFQIWDTAGQEKYRALAPMYYRGSAAAIIVYDVTKEATFHAMQDWVHELQRYGPSKLVIAIAGNKCDLEDLREVTKEDALEYAEEIGAIFCETSAMTAVKVAELFEAIARLLPSEDIEESIRKTRNNTVNLKKNNNKKGGQCCSGSSGNPDNKASSFTYKENQRSRAIPRAEGYRPVSSPS